MKINKIKNISTENLILLSACIDKMDIKDELRKLEISTGDEEKDIEELGSELIVLLITNLYKAKDEIYEFVANYKNISIEEAKKEDIITILNEILGINGAADFLS